MDHIYQKIKETYLPSHQKTYIHVCQVAFMACHLSKIYHLDNNKCILASLLHDISAIMSVEKMYEIAKQRNFDIDESEEKYHFLLHQRISCIMAREWFGVVDMDILSAIECHTTLKKDANAYDRVVFLADKLAWDQAGMPPYFNELKSVCERSLEEGCYWFLKYQFDHQRLLMPHQWLLEAYQQLKDMEEVK